MKTIIGTLIVGLIIAIFTYNLNAEKVDIRYALSERIPTKLLEEKTTESIQQLEVFNIGNAEAKQIRVVIAARISSYELRKYSNADTPKEYKTKDALEIVYPNLPPGGNLKLLIKSVGSGVNKGNLDISHSKGKAEEAFAKTGIASIISFVTIAWVIIIWGSLLFSMRVNAIDSLESSAKYNADKILRKKKPFYINSDKWYSIRKTALESKIERDSERRSDKSTSYQILSIDKPDYLNDEEWLSIKGKAINQLSKMLSFESYTAWKPSRIVELLNIPKPLHFPEKEWTEIARDLNQKYIVMVKGDKLFQSIEITLSNLKQNKPDGILDDCWADYLKYLRREYNSMLFQELGNEWEPMRFIEKCDLDVLNDKERNELKKFAYAAEIKEYFKFKNLSDAEAILKSQKPAWMTEKDYELLLSQARDTVELKVNQKKNIILRQLLQSILYKHPLLTKKPDELTDEEWGAIEQIDKDVRIRSVENSDKEKEIAKEKAETVALKEKVVRQLRVIDDVFKDPQSIYKIEEYDNVFAPGNYENLKKIAERLAAQGNHS
ncbi:MAG: hypothetical protein M0R70_00605 [Nitrospirae bacterium]|nr:hypothetical protein [Nitrospirota bacterium]